ncbi:hypothetical protein LFREDSHE_16500 [Shewanella baltica]
MSCEKCSAAAEHLELISGVTYLEKIWLSPLFTSMFITAACEFIFTAQKSPSDTAIYHMIEGRCIGIDKHSSGRGHDSLQTDKVKII